MRLVRVSSRDLFMVDGLAEDGEMLSERIRDAKLIEENVTRAAVALRLRCSITQHDPCR